MLTDESDQYIEKAQLKFEVSENINQPKFGLVKNDYFIADINWVQVIENIIKRKIPFNGFFIESTY